MKGEMHNFPFFFSIYEQGEIEDIFMREENQPFIKRFKTKKNKYIYDVNTNRIVLVNNYMYETIPLINDYSKEEIFERIKNKIINIDKAEYGSSYDKILNAKAEHNIFSSLRPKARGAQNIIEKDDQDR